MLNTLGRGAAGVAVPPAGFRLVEAACEQVGYIGNSWETLGALVGTQCTLCVLRGEELAPAAAEAPAPFPSSWSVVGPLEAEAPRGYERRNSNPWRSLCTPREAPLPVSLHQERRQSRKQPIYDK